MTKNFFLIRPHGICVFLNTYVYWKADADYKKSAVPNYYFKPGIGKNNLSYICK